MEDKEPALDRANKAADLSGKSLKGVEAENRKSWHKTKEPACIDPCNSLETHLGSMTEGP